MSFIGLMFANLWDLLLSLFVHICCWQSLSTSSQMTLLLLLSLNHPGLSDVITLIHTLATWTNIHALGQCTLLEYIISPNPILSHGWRLLRYLPSLVMSELWMLSQLSCLQNSTCLIRVSANNLQSLKWVSEIISWVVPQNDPRVPWKVVCRLSAEFLESWSPFIQLLMCSILIKHTQYGTQ